MPTSHPGKAGVEGEHQVEALLRPHLPHDDPGRAHAQALLNQVAQPDLSGALEAGLTGLEGHVVGVGEAQLVDLLGGDHALTPGDRGGQAVQHRGLPGLRTGQ